MRGKKCTHRPRFRFIRMSSSFFLPSAYFDTFQRKWNKICQNVFVSYEYFSLTPLPPSPQPLFTVVSKRKTISFSFFFLPLFLLVYSFYMYEKLKVFPISTLTHAPSVPIIVSLRLTAAFLSSVRVYLNIHPQLRKKRLKYLSRIFEFFFLLFS